MTNSYSRVFGGSAVRPSQSSYEALTLSTNTVLVWPLESAEGVPYVASQMDVSATVGSLLLAMPDARLGSLGQSTVMSGVGAFSFTLTDATGAPIQTIAPGQTYLVSMTSNLTQAGTWRLILMGLTGSIVTASSLAGPGLQVKGSTLTPGPNTVFLNTNTTLTEAHRNALIVWQGAAASTLLLDTIANVTSAAPAWVVSIANETGSPVTIATSGSDTINGIPSGQLASGATVTIVASPSGYNALSISGVSSSGGGGGSFNTATLPLGLSGTTLTLSSAQAQNLRFTLTGALTGNFTLSFPAATGFWIVNNQTTGSYTMTVNTAAAAGSVVVPQGCQSLLVSDGANIVQVMTDGNGLLTYGQSSNLELSSKWLS